ncbi:hypothetical protein ABXN37_01505 [Piscinibacter sakaiensis]|uniref:Uncharacterized protein n=1 Tax=Piscinibacter sakaiensis TaxID=1547922 RepID=A0A0K8NU01_PISS1|nr:hypothetical protein [Piscinibacter sakaiensis]GAP33843.1 hypothetical protein ISF6_1098 [Piscinibacter sakaiensis]
MPLIIQERSQAEEHAVAAGDTLASIAAAKCPALGWKTLALYNFGTARPAEVRRALCETVGVALATLADPALEGTPEQLKLQPDADLAPKLKIPKAWEKDGLSTQQTHTVNVNPLKPANAVRILELDKWFIPEQEQCAVRYELQGEGSRADKLSFEVYANQYCDATDWNRGFGSFGDPAALVDVPVTITDLASQSAERSSHGLPGDGWKGEVTTTQGMLGRKTGTAAKRHINVAFSPYTAHFRYHKADGDKTAHLVLEPFWPQWEETKSEPAATGTVEGGGVRIAWTNAAKADLGAVEVFDATGRRVHVAALSGTALDAGAQSLLWNGDYLPGLLNGRFGTRHDDDSAVLDKHLVFRSAPYVYKVTTFVRKKKDDSLKVKWEVRNTGRLAEGLLEIVDGKGRVVYQKPLGKGRLSGKQEQAWDGKYPDGLKNSLGGDTLVPADMPYRARLQAHTPFCEPEGLALAVMHTEVRLYVHRENHAPSDLRCDPTITRPGLAIGLGPLVPGDLPAQGDALWNRWKLAEYGFHPGPVTAGGAGTADFQLATREFKRSVPADGSVAAPNFRRQNLDGGNDVAENGELTTALATIRAGDKRAWFGDPALVLGNSDAPDLTPAEAERRLRDPAQQLVVWVDDRQYYTDAGATVDDTNASYTTGNAAANTFGLMNYRGGMSVADAKVATDAQAVARPWLPLQARLALLGRADELDTPFDEARLAMADPAQRAAMARAIGPLRIDWSCEETGADVSTIDTGMTDYVKQYVRSRYHVGSTLHQQQATHTPPGVGRALRYANCPEALGGTRPASLASHAEKHFGTADLSLAPWRAAPVAAVETVMTVVHDHLSAGQRDKTDLFIPHIGTAGAYFHPSNIAGDGYRVRAELRFEKAGDYAFPNVDALKARYPVAPQAQTAALRLWRRTSFRGYVCWGAATGNWGSSFIDVFRNHYRGAHVYYVHEGGAPQTFNATDVFDPAVAAHRTRYNNIISNNVSNATLKDVSRMTLKTDQIWPWAGRTDMGWPWPSAVVPNPAGRAAVVNNLQELIFNHTWRKFRYSLITALVREIEKKGFMRGHLMVEFVASEACCYQAYACNAAPSHTHVYLERGAAPGTRMQGQACPAAGCGGTLSSTGQWSRNMTAIPLPAVGSALGATWLFWQGESIDRLKAVWAHEVMHHRHGEHAANAPGAAATLHDSQANTRETGWGAINGGGVANGWDRRCIMSYSDAWYGELGCFCGKCLLRNRGWRVSTLVNPASDRNEA